MTICPIAIVAGCQKCPAFRICPVKTLLGDVPKAAPPPVAAAKPAPRAGAETRGKAARTAQADQRQVARPPARLGAHALTINGSGAISL